MLTMVRGSDGEGQLGTLGPFTGCAVGCAGEPKNQFSLLKNQFLKSGIDLVFAKTQRSLPIYRGLPGGL